MRWTIPILIAGCITPYSSVCEDGEYLTLTGECHPFTALVGDTAGLNIPDADADADSDTDTDTDSDTDADTDVDVDLIEELSVTCDITKWYYSVSTIEPAGSVELHVAHTGLDDEIERHTLELTTTSGAGGGVYERDLFMVSEYYFENTATQFDCIDGSNPNLTWRVDLYVDPSFSSHIGCVTWGHDPTFYAPDGCMSWGG